MPLTDRGDPMHCMWHTTVAGDGHRCTDPGKRYRVETPFGILLSKPFCKAHMDLLCEVIPTYTELRPEQQ